MMDLSKDNKFDKFFQIYVFQFLKEIHAHKFMVHKPAYNVNDSSKVSFKWLREKKASFTS